MADLADDVVEVLDEARVDRATVFGLSMGGMIAQEVAIRAPRRVGGLVLAATAPPMPAYRPQRSSSVAGLLMRPMGRGETLDAYFRKLWCQAMDEGFVERNPEVLEELVEQIVQRPTPRSMLIHQLRAVVGWGHAARLSQVKSPTIVVHGSADRFIACSAGRTLAGLLPESRFVELDGTGHLVAHEAPGLMLELIAEVTEGWVTAPTLPEHTLGQGPVASGADQNGTAAETSVSPRPARRR
jgi:pimeloyl-ACP methyl ester carboxylesterase